jgi:Ca2+-binding RTX toxin-like protein
MKAMRFIRRVGVSATSAAVMAMLAGAVLGSAEPTQAALIDGGKGPQVLIGTDTDNINNPAIQPAGVAANQSLNNTDILDGGPGNDVLIGLLGSDVMSGGPGHDILVGGPDPGAPNSDIMLGGPGNDVSLWAPGDGSEAFVGGPDTDALVFGVTDRAAGIPILSGPVPGFPQGVPTANVSGQGGFCAVEAAPAGSGYDFLIRFFSRATGNLLVTVRTRDVEQVYCTTQLGGAMTFADLTEDAPSFAQVSLSEVQALNPIVGLMVR